ncbi:hypothetical protein [Pontibacillus sp. HMF3514]|uniref:hypothetical protein n=1 Tax=Pontibacillus sp. HMF3514 TaxID=2692425 RepID=UPI00131F4F2B|nr:hypothetical protein [Pontibacillus sp. HMF3514]QHE52781.1 hypothetical protein GS400_12430 [Pontibacillus sp. HMF3514]
MTVGEVLISILSGLGGGALLHTFKELWATEKNKNGAKWIAKISLLDELEKNYEIYEREDAHGNSLINILEKEKLNVQYGFNESTRPFTTKNWDEIKMAVAERHPELADDIYYFYSRYKELIDKGEVQEIDKKLFEGFSKKHEKLIKQLKK